MVEFAKQEKQPLKDRIVNYARTIETYAINHQANTERIRELERMLYECQEELIKIKTTRARLMEIMPISEGARMFREV